MDSSITSGLGLQYDLNIILDGCKRVHTENIGPFFGKLNKVDVALRTESKKISITFRTLSL